MCVQGEGPGRRQDGSLAGKGNSTIYPNHNHKSYPKLFNLVEKLLLKLTRSPVKIKSFF